MISPRTSAPRSSVVHALEGRPGMSTHSTRCGRLIGEGWAGEYTAQPAEDVNCARCLSGVAADQEALEANAPLKVGQRVGIFTGYLAVGGKWVGSYGTVTGVFAGWNGKPAYTVKADGESESFAYEPWQITADLSADRVTLDAERARSMAAHPAGKGRGPITRPGTGHTLRERTAANLAAQDTFHGQG